MKKTIAFLTSVLIVTSLCFAQKKESKTERLKAKIIAIDKAGWESWKNKDATWFEEVTAEDFISVSSEGISNKEEVIKSVPVDCDIKSFSLNDFGFVQLNKKTVVLTYVATQDGICNGKKMPAKVRASVTYVKRGGKWLEVVYMETAISQ